MHKLTKADPLSPVFQLTEGGTLTIKPGTSIEGAPPPKKLKIPKKLVPGSDYAIASDDGGLAAAAIDFVPDGFFVGGFHVGLDGEIVEASIWDVRFRPAAPDPRGMVHVPGHGWVDIYLLNTDPRQHGTSRARVATASGRRPIIGAEGDSTSLNWYAATRVLESFGKQLLSREEFAAAMAGVEENKTCGKDPAITDHVPGLKSALGIEQATGCLWTWGREIHPEYDGMCVLGGDWVSNVAGPRRLFNVLPAFVWFLIGARGRCDHLILGE